MWINSPNPSDKKEFEIWSRIEITPKIKEEAGIPYPETEIHAKSIEIISPTEYKIKCIFDENRSNIGKLQAAIEQGLLMSFRVYAQNHSEKLPFTWEQYVKARQHIAYARDRKYFWENKKIIPGKPIYLIVEILGIRKWHTQNKEPFFIVFFKLKGNPNQGDVFVSGEAECILMEKYIE